MSIQTTEQQKQWYQSAFELLERTLNGESQSPIHQLRRSALERFLATGFPTTKHEEWRFTNISPIAKTSFQPVFTYDANGTSRGLIEELSFKNHRGPRIVFVDGQFSPDFSSAGQLSDGVVLKSLRSAMKTHPEIVESGLGARAMGPENPFVTLNTAFLQDGAFLLVPERVTLEDAIHLIYVSTQRGEPFAAHPRNLIILGEGSRTSLVETYASAADAAYLMNVTTDIILGRDAVLEHDMLQNESEKAYHVKTLRVRQDARSSYTSNSVNLGGAIVRNTITSELAGEGALSILNGLSLGTGSQLVDNHTAIDHATAHCESHELYKAILDGKAHGVFNGKIFVRKDAQKTDAKQTNKTLLLSDGALINAKPQLEIFADDVKCTHGATVGQLDDEQVFYLRTRGIGMQEARDILTFAFAGDVVERITIAELKNQLASLVQAKLDRGRRDRQGQQS